MYSTYTSGAYYHAFGLLLITLGRLILSISSSFRGEGVAWAQPVWVKIHTLTLSCRGLSVRQ